MERITSEARLAEIIERGNGFIYNEYEPGQSGPNPNLLHRAGCSHLRTANLAYPKWYSVKLTDSLEWLRVNRGPEGGEWRRCSRCRGMPSS